MSGLDRSTDGRRAMTKRTDEELQDLYERTPGTNRSSRRAIYDLGRTDGREEGRCAHFIDTLDRAREHVQAIERAERMQYARNQAIERADRVERELAEARALHVEACAEVDRLTRELDKARVLHARNIAVRERLGRLLCEFAADASREFPVIEADKTPVIEADKTPAGQAPHPKVGPFMDDGEGYRVAFYGDKRTVSSLAASVRCDGAWTIWRDGKAGEEAFGKSGGEAAALAALRERGLL